MLYGEETSKPKENNLIGQLYLHLDGAGLVKNESYDFEYWDNFMRRALVGGEGLESSKAIPARL